MNANELWLETKILEATNPALDIPASCWLPGVPLPGLKFFARGNYSTGGPEGHRLLLGGESRHIPTARRRPVRFREHFKSVRR